MIQKKVIVFSCYVFLCNEPILFAGITPFVHIMVMMIYLVPTLVRINWKWNLGTCLAHIARWAHLSNLFPFFLCFFKTILIGCLVIQIPKLDELKIKFIIQRNKCKDNFIFKFSWRIQKICIVGYYKLTSGKFICCPVCH